MLTCFQDTGGTWLIPMSILTFVFALRFPLASVRGMMTPSQMLAQGITQGIPLTGHGSTWVCLFALNPILSFFIAEYWNQWTIDEQLIARAFGYGFSAVAHLVVYVKGKYPEADIEPGVNGKRGNLTLAGWVHLFYFGEAVSILILIYAFTDGIPTNLLFALTYYMVGHIWVGNHFVNRINKPHWFPEDYAFTALDAWVPVFAVLVILCTAAWWNLRRDSKSRSNLELQPLYWMHWTASVPIIASR